MLCGNLCGGGESHSSLAGGEGLGPTSLLSAESLQKRFVPFPTHLKAFSNKLLYAKSCCTPSAAANFKHSSIMSQTPEKSQDCFKNLEVLKIILSGLFIFGLPQQ